MRFQHVISRVYGEPWNITPAGWYAIHQLVMAHFDEVPRVEEMAREIEAKRPERKFSLFGNGEPIDQMRIDKGVAVIPVKGTMLKGASMFTKSCGAVSHEDVHEDLDNALAAGVKGIVLDINSPGGTVMGTPELAAHVAEIRNRGTAKIVAYTDSLTASAAYYTAAGAHEIYASPSATVGSIGTIWEFQNVTKALEQRGISYHIFTSGPFKGTGHPARDLTEEQAAWIQGHVDMLAGQFKDHVRMNRPKVAEETMQGQIFTGEQAMKAGLVDGLITRLQDAIDIARG